MVNIFHMPVTHMSVSFRNHLLSFPPDFFYFLMELEFSVIVDFCKFVIYLDIRHSSNISFMEFYSDLVV